jgi:hypothetical protein
MLVRIVCSQCRHVGYSDDRLLPRQLACVRCGNRQRQDPPPRPRKNARRRAKAWDPPIRYRLKAESSAVATAGAPIDPRSPSLGPRRAVHGIARPSPR